MRTRRKLVEHTVALWRARTGRVITQEDARQIVENVSGFFQVLDEWDRKVRSGESRRGLTAENDKEPRDGGEANGNHSG